MISSECIALYGEFVDYIYLKMMKNLKIYKMNLFI
jgi:hypothetical protein